jgi:hypothetical protein
MDRYARRLSLILPLVAVLAGMADAKAGEIVSGGPSCELAATASRPCAWKASHCKQPDVPMLYVASNAEFNRAAAMLSTYAEGLNAYMSCVASEARADLNSAGALINASLDKTQSGATDNFNRLKAQLDAARLKLELK